MKIVLSIEQRWPEIGSRLSGRLLYWTSICRILFCLYKAINLVDNVLTIQKLDKLSGFPMVIAI
jgi:hypothetical protein